MFTIYGRANSSNVRKVLWLCAELGLDDYERLDYGRGYTPCDSPEYVKLNPNKVVPTLVDGDLVVWESNTIMRYLAMKHGPETIYPTDLAARTRVEMWLDWQQTTLLPGIRDLFMGLVVKLAPHNAPETLETNRKQTAAAMEVLDAKLDSGGYAAGGDLTIADCAIGMFVHRWYALDVERPDLPSVAAYYERLKARGPFQEWIVGLGV